jgi:ankyrin repeat protein
MSEPANISSIWDIDLKSANGLQELESFLSQGGNSNEVRYVNTDYLHTFIGDAAYARNIEAIELLARYGADVDLGGGKLGSSGSALLIASELGHLEICKLLIRYGADVNMPCNGTTFPGTFNIPHLCSFPLYQAAACGQSEVVKLLLEHGAKPDRHIGPFLIFADVDTPISAAAEGGYLEAVQALIDGGADVNFKHQFGFSALHKAIVQSHLEVFNHLVENGADINQISFIYGATPLWLAEDAVRRKPSTESKEIRAYLKEHGGSSSLHWWAEILALAGLLSVH